MAGAGLFQMAPYQWTDTAGLSMRGLELAGKMAAAHDKKINQTQTTTKSGGSSGLGSTLGSIAGGVLGSMIPGVGTGIGTMIGSSLGGALGGAIDGGSAGAAAGLAGGFGLGMGLAGSDTWTEGMGGMWENLGIKGGGGQTKSPTLSIEGGASNDLIPKSSDSSKAFDLLPKTIGEAYQMELKTQPLGWMK